MKKNQLGMVMAVKEHLHSGKPLTRLEALVLFGASNLPAIISHMRKSGWIIEKRNISFLAAVQRVNKFAVLEPPANLPVKQIQITEYWVVK